MTTTLPIDHMIDLKRGAISREIFVSPDFYREELEKLFTRAWLFVGHESQIPNPGDFFVSRMGEESVILCRDAQSAVHVFPQFMPPSRHEGVPLRAGQYLAVRLPVSLLELHDGRQAAGRAALPRFVRRHAEARGLVADRGAASRHIQEHGVGIVGSGGAGSA